MSYTREKNNQMISMIHFSAKEDPRQKRINGLVSKGKTTNYRQDKKTQKTFGIKDGFLKPDCGIEPKV